MGCFAGRAFCVLVVTLFSVAADADATIYVDASVPDGGDGQTWATAYNDLQDALALAATLNTEPVEVWVAAGTYTPDEPNGDRRTSFVMQNNVALYGGFPIGGGDWASRDPELHETILSGDLNGDDESVGTSDNAYSVIIADGVDSTAILNGLVVTKGRCLSPSRGDDRTLSMFSGGGCYLIDSHPLIENCVFRDNYAASQGGGIRNGQSSPTIKNCRFEGNDACEGGGIANVDSSIPVVVDCVFSANDADYGAGIANLNQSDSNILGCLFENNSCTCLGGGMLNKESSPNVKSCVFQNNESTVRDIVSDYENDCAFLGAGGGGIHNWNACPTISNCTFAGNHVRYSGGAMLNVCGSSPTIVDSRFESNFSETECGAIGNVESSSIIDRCEFVGNEASVISAIADCDSGGSKITDCLFSGNTCTMGGGGGALLISFADTTVDGCIFVENQSWAYQNAQSVIVFRDDGNPVIANSLIIGDSTETGWAAFAGWTLGASFEGDPRFVNCTFVGHEGRDPGMAAGSIASCYYGMLAFENCVFHVPDGSENLFGVDPQGITVQFSCVPGGFAGEGNIDADPLFVAPGYWDDNGTPEDTSDDTWVMGDYRLQSGSPCIDAGSNVALRSGIVTDYAGNYRRWDDPATVDTGVGTAPIVDMGAYEFGSHLPGDMNCDGVVDVFDIDPFVSALVCPEDYAVEYPTCDAVLADCNGDATVDVFDIDAFVAALVGRC